MVKRFLNGFIFGIASILFIVGLNEKEISISFVSLVLFPIVNFNIIKDFSDRLDFSIGVSISFIVYSVIRFILLGI